MCSSDLAAFAGYTPSLVSYVSVFNPISPTVHDTMGGSASCYRLEFGGLACPGEMFGTNAPASTWHMTFDHAALGKVTYFVPVPAGSYVTHFGKQIHWDGAKDEEVVLEIVGEGPATSTNAEAK